MSELGQHVGNHLLDVLFLRERGFKREAKHLNMLLFIKGTFWRTLFGKDADKLEQANEDARTQFKLCFFHCGNIRGSVEWGNFPAKVTAHYHKGTTFMIKFDESVIARDKLLDGK